MCGCGGWTAEGGRTVMAARRGGSRSAAGGRGGELDATRARRMAEAARRFSMGSREVWMTSSRVDMAASLRERRRLDS